MSAPELILHHYDFSSYAEKIRLLLGYKGLAWRSVVQPSHMPKPDLLPLTGGYRRIPVLQVGADVYCDTRLIIAELERRHPAPTIYPAGSRGAAEALALWIETSLFWTVARYASGVNAEHMPAGLHADRAAMRGMPPPDIARLKLTAARNRGQMLPQLAWLADMLQGGCDWLLPGAGPTVADLAAYNALWFLGALKVDLSHELDPWPRLRAYRARLKAFGHGAPAPMSAADALAVARAATPAAAPPSTFDDLAPPVGSHVVIRPEEKFGDDPVEGAVTYVDADRIAIARTDSPVGAVVVHFPRFRYIVKRLD
jgi:glutathione S-transferase